MCAFCLLKQGCEPLRWPSFSLKAVLHQCAGLLLHILFAASKAARRTEYLKAAAKDVQKVAAFKKKSSHYLYRLIWTYMDFSLIKLLSVLFVSNQSFQHIKVIAQLVLDISSNILSCIESI